MHRAFAIQYFIGDVPEDIQAHRTAHVLAAVNDDFNATADAYEDCARQETDKVLVKDTNPIITIFFDYQNIGRLAILHPENVVPVLRTTPHWRVVGVRHCCLHVDDYREAFFNMTP